MMARNYKMLGIFYYVNSSTKILNIFFLLVAIHPNLHTNFDWITTADGGGTPHPNYRRPPGLWTTKAKNHLFIGHLLHTFSLRGSSLPEVLDCFCLNLFKSLFNDFLRLGGGALIWFQAGHLIMKHCQRHNGPEGWVHITSCTQILIKLQFRNLD